MPPPFESAALATGPWRSTRPRPLTRDTHSTATDTERRFRMKGLSAANGGSATIHGQSKDVTFHYVAKNSGVIDVTGTTRINVNDFGVKPRSYLGVGIKPDIDINVHFQAKDG